MLKKHSQLFEWLFMAADLFVVSIAWCASYWIRFTWGEIPTDKGIPPFVDYLKMLLFVWLIWAFVFRQFGLYRPMRGLRRIKEVWQLVQANFWGIILLLAATYLFFEKSVPYSRLVFVIFGVLATASTIASRVFIRNVLRSIRKRGINLRHALIVGSGELAELVARKMLSHKELGVRFVGCLSRESVIPTTPRLVANGATNGNGSSNGARYTNGHAPVSHSPLHVIGSYRDLPNLLELGGIDQVILALPLADHDLLPAVISSIGDSMVDVKIVPDFHRFVQLGASVEEFEGLAVMSLSSTPLIGVNQLVKRSVDVLLGVLFLLISSPVILLTALMVKLTSRGPIFYSQERVGLDGKKFNIYKFRTMRTDAEHAGAKFATKGDPRVTPMGKFLRRFSIDEIPQLFNVIVGHMSLVGPRPERPVFIEEFRQHFPRYMLRHKVQAGMTGWAQVNGWRGNTSIERRIEHDLYYIENWSLALDLKIIGMTFFRTLRDDNAY